MTSQRRAAEADVRTIEDHAISTEGRWQRPGLLRRLYEQAAERRRRDPRLPDFEVVEDERGAPLLVASDELLVRAEDLAGRESALPPGAARPEPVPGTGGRVLRLALSPERELRSVKNDRGALHRDGVPAAYNYVTAMQVVIKSKGGASPATRSWPALDQVAVTEGPVRVAVIDTGVADQKRADGWLAGLARQPGTLGPDDPGTIDLLDVSPANSLLDAAGGHGTAVAGLVQSEAPLVPLVVYNPVPSDGGAAETEVARVLVQAVQEAFDAGQSVVVNLSLGTSTLDDTPPLALQGALDTIDAMAAESPLEALVVAAAGNDGDTRPVWPAACRGVVAVGALTQQLTGATWSSRGIWVDCSVIGDGVLTTYVEGCEDPAFGEPADSFGPDAFALVYGTSFAAPQVAGRVARIATEERIGLRDALGRLLTDAPRDPAFGRTLTIQAPIV
ncbi:MAG TPA: S8/S53 family peptidase [Mycobacteriales bacterium]|nr:S8/S53 family peptidase [Mycobacteriales bacterium]